MKINLFFLFSFFFLVSVFSQHFETIHTFQFGETFEYSEYWDRVEGSPPGILNIEIQGNIACLGDMNPSSWIFFQANEDEWNYLTQIEAQFGAFHTWSNANSFIVFQVRSGGGFRILNSSDPNYTIYDIAYNRSMDEIDRIRSSLPPFLTGNYLFCESSDRNLYSFELLPDGEFIFRNIEETQKLLDEGLADQLGFYKSSNGRNNNFGDFSVSHPRTIHYPEIKRELNFEGTQFPDLTSLQGFSTIGYDSRGINYFFTLLPEPFGFVTAKLADENNQVVIAIVDTWTKQVSFRILPPGGWSPPVRQGPDGYYETIGTYPNTVHPNGDIYFVDADTELQEYQIKRLSNDWWAELGIDEREILRIDGNHIPLRVEPDSSQNNGYNFENEFVWVQEHQGEWLRVRKIDGREGWILESETYDEGY